MVCSGRPGLWAPPPFVCVCDGQPGEEWIAGGQPASGVKKKQIHAINFELPENADIIHYERPASEIPLELVVDRLSKKNIFKSISTFQYSKINEL